MSNQTDLGMIDGSTVQTRSLAMVRLLLPVGWALAAVGYYGPWISHATAGLTLSGVDMGEFVKFLPDVLNGALAVSRPLFYLPPFAIAVTIALLIGSRQLRYPWPVRVLALLLAVAVSLQLLPPAWSPASLFAAEFRLQALALVICWILLAGYWLLGRLPSWLTGSLSAVLSTVAMGASAWQFALVKPSVDRVYRIPPMAGWGLFLCMGGLAILAAGSVMLVLRTRARAAPWARQ